MKRLQWRMPGRSFAELWHTLWTKRNGQTNSFMLLYLRALCLALFLVSKTMTDTTPFLYESLDQDKKKAHSCEYAYKRKKVSW